LGSDTYFLKDFENIVIENETAFIYKDGRKEAIGKLVNGILLRGFKTPSRKFEIYSADVRDAAHKMGLEDDGFPHFVMPKSLKEISSDDLVLTTFKWNVHTQARTAPQKYLSEIVHDNPVWINTQTARKYGIKNGDMIEITTYRPQSGFKASQKKIVVGKMSVHAFVTQGIHPRVIAVSNSLGMNFGGRIPCARNGKKQNIPAFNSNDNVDFKRNIWWDKRLGGTGNGVNPNSVIPINPSPLVGMQAWNDTVCSIKKIKT